jgi:hypothetical protein
MNSNKNPGRGRRPVSYHPDDLESLKRLVKNLRSEISHLRQDNRILKAQLKLRQKNMPELEVLKTDEGATLVAGFRTAS